MSKAETTKREMQETIDLILAGTPVIEFAIGVDWWQFDAANDMTRCRHHRAPGWGQWSLLPSIRRLFYRVEPSTIRIVPRAEADDWWSRPGFPCHQEVP
jgi:hypothetical protein